jgi:hypothetical protein
MCYVVKNWSLLIALVVILETIEVNEVCSSVMMRAIACVVPYFATLKASDVGGIVLVGLCDICVSISSIVALSRLVSSLLSSLLESSALVGGSGTV